MCQRSRVRPRAVLKTSGTAFSSTGLPTGEKHVSIIFGKHENDFSNVEPKLSLIL